MVTRVLSVASLVVIVLFAGCSNPTEPADAADFVVSVSGERFVLRLTDAATIQLAEDNRLGRNQKFPLGPLRQGNGGFNAPWNWHFDPAETRFVDLAIELCDGRPSYVEEHLGDYPTYCPWGAKVVERK
jgi:hypothetical protein